MKVEGFVFSFFTTFLGHHRDRLLVHLEGPDGHGGARHLAGLGLLIGGYLLVTSRRIGPRPSDLSGRRGRRRRRRDRALQPRQLLAVLHLHVRRSSPCSAWHLRLLARAARWRWTFAMTHGPDVRALRHSPAVEQMLGLAAAGAAPAPRRLRARGAVRSGPSPALAAVEPRVSAVARGDRVSRVTVGSRALETCEAALAMRRSGW